MPGSTVLLIGVSMTVLLVISLFTFLCFNRRHVHRAPPSQWTVVDDVELGHGCAVTGIDEAVLAAYTTTVDTHMTCAVCPAEYADGDELRQLPGCKHAFHRLCVDEWLQRRPSCPLCRMSPPAVTTEDS
ncbi:hypothetical protein VPH35_087869 [Triticum aestivum]